MEGVAEFALGVSISAAAWIFGASAGQYCAAGTASFSLGDASLAAAKGFGGPFAEMAFSGGRGIASAVIAAAINGPAKRAPGPTEEACCVSDTEFGKVWGAVNAGLTAVQLDKSIPNAWIVLSSEEVPTDSSWRSAELGCRSFPSFGAAWACENDGAVSAADSSAALLCVPRCRAEEPCWREALAAGWPSTRFSMLENESRGGASGQRSPRMGGVSSPAAGAGTGASCGEAFMEKNSSCSPRRATGGAALKSQPLSWPGPHPGGPSPRESPPSRCPSCR